MEGRQANSPLAGATSTTLDGNGGKAVVLFKNREGGNIIAEIIFAVLQEGREGINVERVLTHNVGRADARGVKCASLKHCVTGDGYR